MQWLYMGYLGQTANLTDMYTMTNAALDSIMQSATTQLSGERRYRA